MSQCQRDPFVGLPLEIIGSIIARLPKETTETLRRVSKSWKILAESYCTGHAIKQHFPGTAAAKKTFKSNKEANLTFRRLLYQQKSMLNGHVTRVFQYSKVKSWHFSRDSLLWVDQSWTITIKNLHSQEEVSLPVESWSRALGAEKIVVTDAFATNDRGILIAIQSSDDVEDQGNDNGNDFDALALISYEGLVHWCLQLMASTSAQNLLVHADTFYYTSNMEEEVSPCSMFTTRSVSDASLIHEIRLAVDARSREHYAPQNQNKRFAILVSTDGGDFIINILTGHIVLRVDRSSNIILSAVEDKAWTVPVEPDDSQDGSIILSEFHYDPQKQALVPVESVHEAQFMDERCWGLDGDHQLLFTVELSNKDERPESEDLERSLKHTAFVASLEPQHLHDEEEFKRCRPVQLSLPGHPKRDKLEFNLSSTAADSCEDITFHVIDGYLMVQERVYDDSTLVLMDFRPTW